MKKGFTLIELLAVIVILAIIALIAVPIILNIIKDSKEQANMRSAEMYMDAVKKSVMRYNLTNKFPDTRCDILEGGNLDCDDLDDILKVEISNSNQIKAGGEIRFEKLEIVELEGLTINDTKYKLENKKLIVMGSSSDSGESETPTDESCFTYIDEVSNYTINYDTCVAVLPQFSSSFGINLSNDEYASLCEGSEVDGYSIDAFVTNSEILAALTQYGVISVSGMNKISNNGIYITDYTCSDKDVVIPSNVDGKNVVGIAASAFKDKQLTSIIIPTSVTRIFPGAFQSNQLTNVTIPNSVTSIGGGAFINNNINTLQIGSTVQTIGQSAFQNNAISNLIIPNSVTTIGSFAFTSNEIKTLSIGNNVELIDEMAYAGNRLTTVEIPNSVTTIGETAFAGNQLTSVKIGSGITNINKGAFSSSYCETRSDGTWCGTIEELTGDVSNAYGRNMIEKVTIDRYSSDVIISNNAFGWASSFTNDDICWKGQTCQN